MSDNRYNIPGDMYDNQYMYDLDRLDSEGYIQPKPTYACSYGNHKWKWYVGFHMERYWFCELCDDKDFTRSPPKS